jgi:hypothetical protein
MSLDFSSFSSRPILDGHVHVWANCDVSALWETLTRTGAQRCNVLAIGDVQAAGTYNAAALRFKAAAEGRAYCFGGLDYATHARGEIMRPDELVQQVEQLWALGFDGVKMWEGKPSVYVSLPDRLEGAVYAPFFAWLEAHEFPLLLHIADAPRLWDAARVGLERWLYVGAQYPTRQALYAELERILARHPRLRLIVAHLGFWWNELDEAARFLDAHPTTMFDLTPGVEGFVQLSENVAAARAFFLRYQDRLIYGTDIGAGVAVGATTTFDGEREAGQAWLVRAFLETDWAVPLPPGVGTITNLFAGRHVCGLALPDEVLQKIYVENFERMVEVKSKK